MTIHWKRLRPNRFDVASMVAYGSVACLMDSYGVPVMIAMATIVVVIVGSALAQEGNDKRRAKYGPVVTR